MTDFNKLEEVIDQASSQNNLTRLKELQAFVLANSTFENDLGAMRGRLVFNKDAEQKAQKLGITLETQTEGLVDIANRVTHAIRHLEFQSQKVFRPHLETVVCEGDSWFLHPLVEDAVDQLRFSRYNIRSMAAAGDTVANMLAGTGYLRILKEEDARIFLFSGGGNDLLGDGRIIDFVVPYDDTKEIKDHLQQDLFEGFLAQIIDEYRRMAKAIQAERPGVQIFTHGYATSSKIGSGKWIWPYLSELGFTKSNTMKIVDQLLAVFNDALKRLDTELINFTYVDMRDVVGAGSGAWFDAIHPSDAGFKRVADRMDEAIALFLSSSPRSGATESTYRTAATPQSIAEAVVFGGNPNLTEFENFRARVASVPDDESLWSRFSTDSDPKLVWRTIRAVKELASKGSQPESQERIQNRMRTSTLTVEQGPFRSLAGFAPVDAHENIEAIFGRSQIEHIQVLHRGYKAGKAVGMCQIMDQFGALRGFGSGFLVGPGLFLTNHHVFDSPHKAARSTVVFDHETHLNGSMSRPVAFEISDEIYVASKELDYAFVSVRETNHSGARLADYGQLDMIRESGKALKYEQISIIQHPQGNPKSIAFRNSIVIGRKDEGLYYTTDTQGGSSGSPVLNQEWQVVGLHHRYVPHPTRNGEVLANRGIRVSSIFDSLEELRGKDEPMAIEVLNRLQPDRQSDNPQEAEFPFGPRPNGHTPDLSVPGHGH